MAFLDWFKGSSIPKDWKHLNKKEEVDSIFSTESAQLNIIFKHSTRCGISHASLQSFIEEYETIGKPVHVYYLDLLAHRDISNYIAEKSGIVHQSPQIIAIKAGEVVANASHHKISLNIINDFMEVETDKVNS